MNVRNELILAASRIYNLEGITPEERAEQMHAATIELLAADQISIADLEEYNMYYGMRAYENIFGNPVWDISHPNLTHVEVVSYQAADDRSLTTVLGYLSIDKAGSTHTREITPLNMAEVIEAVEGLSFLHKLEQAHIIQAIREL